MKITENEKKQYETAFKEYVDSARYPSEGELKGIEFSADFSKKMEECINKNAPLRVRKTKILMRIAACFAAVFVLAVGSLAVGTFAEPVKPANRVKDIIDIYNQYIYETEGEYNYVFCLKYIPEGYKEAGGGGAGNYSCDRYENEKGDSIEFYRYTELPLPVIDRFADVHKEIDGGLYVMNTNTGESRYIISIYDHVFDIRADNLPREEVMSMAKSISRLIIEGKDEQ